MRGIHRWPVNSPHKGPVTRKKVYIWWRHHEITQKTPNSGKFRRNSYGNPGFLVFIILQWIQYIPRNMHTVFALLCFVVVIHWLISPYPSGLLNWHCGNLTIAPVPAKQPWWIWINTSCEFILNDSLTTTKQSTTKPCAYFLGYTVCVTTWFLYIDMLGYVSPYQSYSIVPLPINLTCVFWLVIWIKASLVENTSPIIVTSEEKMIYYKIICGRRH